MSKKIKISLIIGAILTIILLIVAAVTKSFWLTYTTLIFSIAGNVVLLFWDVLFKFWKTIFGILAIIVAAIFLISFIGSCNPKSTIKETSSDETTTEKDETSAEETTEKEETTTEKEDTTKKKEKPSKEKPSKEETTEAQEGYTDGVVEWQPVETTTSEIEDSPEVEEITTRKKEKKPREEVETTIKKKNPVVPEVETTKKKEKETTREEATTKKETEETNTIIEPENPFEETTTVRKEIPSEEETTEEQTTIYVAPEVDIVISHTAGATNVNVLTRVVSGTASDISFVVRLDNKVIEASSYMVFNNNDGSYSLKIPVDSSNEKIEVLVKDGIHELRSKMKWI